MIKVIDIHKHPEFLKPGIPFLAQRISPAGLIRYEWAVYPIDNRSCFTKNIKIQHEHYSEYTVFDSDIFIVDWFETNPIEILREFLND